MRYVSPFDPTAHAELAPAPRPDTLDGRTVALLDISKNRGAEFLDVAPASHRPTDAGGGAGSGAKVATS